MRHRDLRNWRITGMSPPATLNPDQRFNAFVQDTLSGPIPASIPFFDERRWLAC
jgi:hypothetical protein